MGGRERELELTRLRIEQLHQRLLELDRRNQELAGQIAPADAPPDQVRRAAELARQARVHADAALARVIQAYLRAAAAHDAAAERHEELAAGGFGQVEEHQQRARAHREMSAADRELASVSRHQAIAATAVPDPPPNTGASRQV